MNFENKVSKGETIPFNQCEKKKKVRFDSTVYITLVPERKEFINCGIASSIWWSKEEHNSFVCDARQELKSYMTDNAVDNKEATKRLYQPGEEDIRYTGSPTSVVPNYDEYKKLIDAYASPSDSDRFSASNYSGEAQENNRLFYFTSIAASSDQTTDDNSDFVHVHRRRSSSVVGGSGILSTDDSWTVLKEAPGCAGLL